MTSSWKQDEEDLEEAEQVYDRAEIGHRSGYGDTPALLVIDLQNGITDPEYSLGADISSVVENTDELIETAHDAGVQVIFSQVRYTHPEAKDAGAFARKIPTLSEMKAGSEAVELDERLDVAESDYHLVKKQASSFHDTELASLLTSWGVDTVIATGYSTSGCVRASVVDSVSHGFRTVVPEECVGDRAEGPHKANLFDMQAKYADVRPMADVKEYLAERPQATPKA